MRKLFFIGIFFSTTILNAQIYYGEKNRGKLEILNDSVYVARFYTEFGFGEIYQHPDTGNYRKSNDTIWLSSRPSKPFEIVVSEKGPQVNTGFTVLTKKYFKEKPKGEYKLVYEGWNSIFDTLNEQIVYDDYYVSKDCILVINPGFGYEYRLKWKGKSTSSFTLKFLSSKRAIRTVYLDEFPLFIKKDKLIPVDKEKIEQCWIDNGFYFPVMKKSDKEKEFKTIARWTIGLQGLPCSICVPVW